MDNFRECLEKLIRPDDKERVWLFFLAFSRFEFALKRSGFAKGSADRVDAAWDRFASGHCHAFKPDSDQRLRSACDYFANSPPMKQVLKDSSIGFVGPNPLGSQPHLCWLTTMLRRVRNNLFHGGKFEPTALNADPARDAKLIEHSLVILEACVELDTGVQQSFMEPNH